MAIQFVSYATVEDWFIKLRKRYPSLTEHRNWINRVRSLQHTQGMYAGYIGGYNEFKVDSNREALAVTKLFTEGTRNLFVSVYKRLPTPNEHTKWLTRAFQIQPVYWADGVNIKGTVKGARDIVHKEIIDDLEKTKAREKLIAEAQALEEAAKILEEQAKITEVIKKPIEEVTAEEKVIIEEKIVEIKKEPAPVTLFVKFLINLRSALTIGG